MRGWAEEDMAKAFAAVESGILSSRMAAKEYGVPRSTVPERVNGKRELKARWGKAPKMTGAHEKNLARL